MTDPAMEVTAEVEERRRRSWAPHARFRGTSPPKAAAMPPPSGAYAKPLRTGTTGGSSLASVTQKGPTRTRHDDQRQAGDKDHEDTIPFPGHCQYRRRRRSPGEGIYGRSMAHDLAASRGMARQTVNEEER